MIWNNEEISASLKDIRGGEIALKAVNVVGTIEGLLSSIEVEQIYLNPQSNNIEVVYTFPLPIGAVMLGLEVELGGTKLKGTAVERKIAEDAYEDAITDGQTVVMVETAGPGLYTANLGNLMANESAIIRYRYAMPLLWQDSKIRFLLPTTIAPRYGNAKSAGLHDHQIPTSSLLVEYPLNLSITIDGELSKAKLQCLSHPIEIRRVDDSITVNIGKNATLDRDFVLTIEPQSASSSSFISKDAEGYVAMASLRIPPLSENNISPLKLHLIIDCSGSMAGISISQARKAALEILNQLSPTDQFNITLFGSHHEHVFNEMVRANQPNIAHSWQRLERLAAEMGGTEMQSALDAAFSICQANSEILLITDGAIFEHEKLVKRAEEENHRIFVIGVGTSVSETFLKSLANATNGACALVASQEGMSEAVLAQFHRLRQPRYTSVKINWPIPPLWETPLPETVFAGDTIHVFAGFPRMISGDVLFNIKDTSLGTSAFITSMENPDLPRIAAANRLCQLSREQAIVTALKYQLLTDWTNYIVIAEDAPIAKNLPAIHHVPQMVSNSLMAYSYMSNRSLFSVHDQKISNMTSPSPIFYLKSTSRAEMYSHDDFDDDIPFISLSSEICSPEHFISKLEELNFDYPDTPKIPTNLSELRNLNLDFEIANALYKLIKDGHPENSVVACFLYTLVNSSIGSLIGRNLRRYIIKNWKNLSPDDAITDCIAYLLKDIQMDSWGKQCELAPEFRIPR